MREDGEIEERGKKPHGADGFLIECSLEEVERGCYAKEQEPVFANFGRQGDQSGRKRDNNESNQACRFAEERLDPFESEPAKRGARKHQWQAEYELGAAQEMANI